MSKCIIIIRILQKDVEELMSKLGGSQHNYHYGVLQSSYRTTYVGDLVPLPTIMDKHPMRAGVKRLTAAVLFL